MRQDFRPQPQRTYATLGIEGFAPFWFEGEAQAFLSNKGDVHFRADGSYDQRITQRLVLQPAVEVNIAAQDVPELGIGSGLSNIELGLRLRYEPVREFAPYAGINWECRFRDTACYARAGGRGVGHQPADGHPLLVLMQIISAYTAAPGKNLSSKRRKAADFA